MNMPSWHINNAFHNCSWHGEKCMVNRHACTLLRRGQAKYLSPGAPVWYRLQPWREHALVWVKSSHVLVLVANHGDTVRWVPCSPTPSWLCAVWLGQAGSERFKREWYWWWHMINNLISHVAKLTSINWDQNVTRDMFLTGTHGLEYVQSIDPWITYASQTKCHAAANCQ